MKDDSYMYRKLWIFNAIPHCRHHWQYKASYGADEERYSVPCESIAEDTLQGSIFCSRSTVGRVSGVGVCVPELVAPGASAPDFIAVCGRFRLVSRLILYIMCLKSAGRTTFRASISCRSFSISALLSSASRAVAECEASMATTQCMSSAEAAAMVEAIEELSNVIDDEG